MIMISTDRNLDSTQRYYGLDGLRGFAMLTGVLLHASLPYFSRTVGLESIWPADDDQSLNLFLLFDFIHTWRMPTFFLLAGFFAHLILERGTFYSFASDRLRRIALPLLLFGPLFAVLFPIIWGYGWSGSLSIDASVASFRKVVNLESNDGLIGHLWFLYYLLLMYSSLLVVRLLTRLKILSLSILLTWGGFLLLVAYIRGLGPFEGVDLITGLGLWMLGITLSLLITAVLLTAIALGVISRTPLGHWFVNCFYSRLPILLIIPAIALISFRGADESKTLWPVNVPDFTYHSLFFLYGYGLWTKKAFLERLQGSWTLVTLWAAAIITYFLHLIAISAIDGLHPLTQGPQYRETLEFLNLMNQVTYGSAAVLLSLAFIGSFETIFRNPNKTIKWVADSSYWIYIIHLPIVATLTFWFAHLDHNDWPIYIAGMSWNAEAKFVVASAVTTLIGMISYRYLVRYTFIGWLINGRKSKRQSSRHI